MTAERRRELAPLRLRRNPAATYAHADRRPPSTSTAMSSTSSTAPMWKAARETIEDLAKPKDPKSIFGTVTSVIGKGAGLLLSFDVKTVLNIDTTS
ncbi:hypothetical protein ACFYR2_11410 [Streptomyces microflavus]|uniref:hypothetical protein n=1 Tax=Streptomyces microflavus TaxID=1919 RepID=UPI0036C1FEE6